MYAVRTFIAELITFSFAIASFVLARWIMELSTPQKDIAWVTGQPLWYELKRLRWYRGMEYIHQLRFKRLMGL